LLHSVSILTETKSDAAVRNIAALETDSGTLIADGNACLANPPPDHAARQNSAHLDQQGPPPSRWLALKNRATWAN
jgi:hypothetical protein